jgi:hypothetical protein
MNAVDKFVVLDDVNYINKGWINRNNILVNGKANLFAIPLKEASQNKLINEISVVDEAKWRTKLLKTIELSYKKAPFFAIVYPMIEEIINSGNSKISDLNYYSLVRINNYLDLNTEIVSTSSIYKNSDLKAEKRIIDICLKEHASIYINPIGGTEIYDKNSFTDKKLELFFIKSKEIKYIQFNNDFVPWLSIIDVMMFNSLETIKSFLEQYTLV